MNTVDSLRVVADQLVYARHREWEGWFRIDRFKLRDLIAAELNRAYLRGVARGAADRPSTAALRKYGRHLHDCPLANYIPNISEPCSCGFDAAMEGQADA